jgi:hypothetical protein
MLLAVAMSVDCGRAWARHGVHRQPAREPPFYLLYLHAQEGSSVVAAGQEKGMSTMGQGSC